MKIYGHTITEEAARELQTSINAETATIRMMLGMCRALPYDCMGELLSELEHVRIELAKFLHEHGQQEETCMRMVSRRRNDTPK